MLKLYYHPLSTFSQRVRIALIEKRIVTEMLFAVFLFFAVVP